MKVGHSYKTTFYFNIFDNPPKPEELPARHRGYLDDRIPSFLVVEAIEPADQQHDWYFKVMTPDTIGWIVVFRYVIEAINLVGEYVLPKDNSYWIKEIKIES